MNEKLLVEKYLNTKKNKKELNYSDFSKAIEEKDKNKLNYYLENFPLSKIYLKNINQNKFSIIKINEIVFLFIIFVILGFLNTGPLYEYKRNINEINNYQIYLEEYTDINFIIENEIEKKDLENSFNYDNEIEELFN